MGFYSDPTASMAVGNVNREFSKYEKRAKKLRKLYKEGKLSEEALRRSSRKSILRVHRNLPPRA